MTCVIAARLLELAQNMVTSTIGNPLFDESSFDAQLQKIARDSCQYIFAFAYLDTEPNAAKRTKKPVDDLPSGCDVFNVFN